MFENLIHSFHGDTHYKEIKTLCKQISSPSKQERSPIAMLCRFEKLADMANQNGNHDFFVQVNGDRNVWHFSFQLDGEIIYRSSIQEDLLDTPYALFCAKTAALNMKNEMQKVQGGLTLECYIMVKIQCMSDNKEGRSFITANLQNTEYSSEHFRSIEDSKNSEGEFPTFIAHFKGGDLCFSNRVSTHEFRGERLKTALQTGVYTHLEALCSQGYLCATDMALKYLAAEHKQTLFERIGSIVPADREVIHALNTVIIGNTTVGELFGVPAYDVGHDVEDGYVLIEPNIIPG